MRGRRDHGVAVESSTSRSGEPEERPVTTVEDDHEISGQHVGEAAQARLLRTQATCQVFSVVLAHLASHLIPTHERGSPPVGGSLNFPELTVTSSRLVTRRGIAVRRWCSALMCSVVGGPVRVQVP